MEKEEILEYLGNFFKERASRYGLDLVFLYGSRAVGLPMQDSDVDVAVLFSESTLSEEEYFSRICDISLRLSGLLNLEVNIIQIHESFDRPMLYYNAIALGEPIYVRSHDKYSRVRNEAIYQMEDYSIFGLGWQHEVTRRNLEVLRNARVAVR
jgi:predicted nucleotidyltransferase